jgi:signal transduction histidine kinase
MRSTEFQLKERVKELKCLYSLSKIAIEADNDLGALLSKTLSILPSAMQYPGLAEVCITVDKKVYATRGFKQSKYHISSPLIPEDKKRGMIEIGYKTDSRKKQKKHTFLPEEKQLLHTVARELSMFINRGNAELEKQKLQLQLQHVERLAFVGELSAGIAHELNEPLGRILGFAQLIKKAGGMNEQQEQDVERIIKASLYTREIIKKLMIFSRQMPRQVASVNLNEVVANILYFIDMRFQSRRIKTIQRLDQNLPAIQADPVQMSQVLVNLITNAIHAMNLGGELTIATRRKDGGVSLFVKDTGHGMDSEVKKKIFEPFYTTKPVGQGTGLGLSVVQGIITAHHGKIAVTSKPGKGSTFEILMPLRQPKDK